MASNQAKSEISEIKFKSDIPLKDKYIYWTVISLRIIIGATFIFSGFVKVIDPWGTVYKFGEYFSVLGLDFLVSLITLFAFALAIAEFVLGVLIILGCYRGASVWLMLGLMAFMLPLTLYLAITDSVADCGCFGDVVHLSNWVTFFKNVLIVAALIILCKYNKKVGNVYGFASQWIIVLLSGILAYILCFLGYIYQPLIDFRPFKIGTQIAELTTTDSEEPEFKFLYKKGEIQKEFSIDSIPGDDWEFVDRVEVSQPVEKDGLAGTLTVTEDGEDITGDVISAEGDEIIFLFPDLGDIEISSTFAINEIYDLAQNHGVKVVGLTSMSEDDIAVWKDLSMAAYPMYIIDDSVLKQIARGNPAIVYLSDGVIKWKRTMSSIPMEQFTNEALDMEYVDKPSNATFNLMFLIITYITLMIILFILDRTHRIIKFKSSLNKKNENKDVTL